MKGDTKLNRLKKDTESYSFRFAKIMTTFISLLLCGILGKALHVHDII